MTATLPIAAAPGIATASANEADRPSPSPSPKRTDGVKRRSASTAPAAFSTRSSVRPGARRGVARVGQRQRGLDHRRLVRRADRAADQHAAAAGGRHDDVGLRGRSRRSPSCRRRRRRRRRRHVRGCPRSAGRARRPTTSGTARRRRSSSPSAPTPRSGRRGRGSFSSARAKRWSTPQTSSSSGPIGPRPGRVLPSTEMNGVWPGASLEATSPQWPVLFPPHHRKPPLMPSELSTA